MKLFLSLRLAAVLLPIFGVGTAQAATVAVTDGNLNQFGDIGGFAIDFDATTGLTANYEPDLVAGQPYNLNNVTVYRGSDASTGTVYLGVYTSYSANVLSGFLGSSINTLTLNTLAASDPMSFNFTGLTVTPQSNPASGGDVRYFVFQSGTTALTAVGGQSIRVPVRRIDGEVGSFADELSQVIRSDNGDQPANRAVEYSATITPVPEPSGFALLGIASAALMRHRRRQD